MPFVLTFAVPVTCLCAAALNAPNLDELVAQAEPLGLTVTSVQTSAFGSTLVFLTTDDGLVVAANSAPGGMVVRTAAGDVPLARWAHDNTVRPSH